MQHTRAPLPLRPIGLALLTVFALGSVSLCPVARPAFAQATTIRVSVASDGAQGNGAPQEASPPSISADGRYIAFRSDSSNLVPGDTNANPDIFLRDTVAGTTRRVSVATDGTQANGWSGWPSISADGRYVAFDSIATNLVAGDSNASPDVFVRDTVAGTTTRVSVTAGGAQGDLDSYSPSISADGRFVAFESYATNLVSRDTNLRADIFRRDTVAGTTQRVSVATDGIQANNWSSQASISGDGRYVAFYSNATNLVSGDTNGHWDVFVRDILAGTTRRVSVATDGTQGDADSTYPSISADGAHVAFESDASTLVPDDTNQAADVFVRDTVAGITKRVSLASDSAQGGGSSAHPTISVDGRYVAFFSSAANLVPDDTNHFFDAFVKDTETGTTSRVSVATDGTQGNNWSGYWSLAISSDGRYVAFWSDASNLVPDDTNGKRDAFVRGPLFAAAFTAVDVGRCLEIVSGLANASPTDWARLKGVAGTGPLDIADAVRIAQKVAGLEANP